MVEVSAGWSWPKDEHLRCAFWVPGSAGPEIRENQKNVFDRKLLPPSKKVSHVRMLFSRYYVYYKKDLFQWLQNGKHMYYS